MEKVSLSLNKGSDASNEQFQTTEQVSEKSL